MTTATQGVPGTAESKRVCLTLRLMTRRTDHHSFREADILRRVHSLTKGDVDGMGGRDVASLIVALQTHDEFSLAFGDHPGMLLLVSYLLQFHLIRYQLDSMRTEDRPTRSTTA